MRGHVIIGALIKLNPRDAIIELLRVGHSGICKEKVAILLWGPEHIQRAAFGSGVTLHLSMSLGAVYVVSGALGAFLG